MTSTSIGLLNEPDGRQAEKLLYLVTFILQPTRGMFGPLTVTSGFRSTAVNEAVKGSLTSQHCFGEAADIVPAKKSLSVYSLFDYMAHHFKGQYGQIIRETGEGGSKWIHVSLPRVGRKNGEALIYEDGVYSPYKEL